MIKKEIFEEAADIKEQIAKLNDRYDVLKPELATMLIDEGYEEEGLELKDRGVFTIGHRRSYTYSEAIKLADKSLKESKKEAEQTGTATYTESTFPTYTVNK